MDLYATFATPPRLVFSHLADPSSLGTWLCQITGATPAPAADAGAAFRLTICLNDAHVVATGEITEYEPPWLIGYRLFAGNHTLGLRITCSALNGGTRLHVHQPDSHPLIIDIAGLGRVLAALPDPDTG